MKLKDWVQSGAKNPKQWNTPPLPGQISGTETSSGGNIELAVLVSADTSEGFIKLIARHSVYDYVFLPLRGYYSNNARIWTP